MLIQGVWRVFLARNLPHDQAQAHEYDPIEGHGRGDIEDDHIRGVHAATCSVISLTRRISIST